MHTEFIAQPNFQLGKILLDILDTEPKRVVFVSAFVGLQTIMRLKDQVAHLKEQGSNIQIILGIDLGGTSQEVLKELLEWNVDVRIIKHRIPGHTFHPKLYVFEWDHKAEVILGSNNLTEGGFFRNYEGCVRITYKFPDDLQAFETACAELKRFIMPSGPTVYILTDDFLKELIEKNEILTEAEARKVRDIGETPRTKKVKGGSEGGSPFGVEEIPPPPPLPVELLERLVKDIRRRKRDTRTVKAAVEETPSSTTQAPISEEIKDVLLPAAFYMTLPTLQGASIPGESRIPLEAIELAHEFWGWPDEYSKDVSPRAGNERIYWNWRPKWRIWSVYAPENIVVQEIRMYMYTNSSDFRFYARPLVNAGADLGDVVRIRRIAEPDAEYECVLARQGTTEYNEWIKHCTQTVQNSTRRFGYA